MKNNAIVCNIGNQGRFWVFDPGLNHRHPHMVVAGSHCPLVRAKFCGTHADFRPRYITLATTPSQETCHDNTTGVRIGEASHPGPAAAKATARRRQQKQQQNNLGQIINLLLPLLTQLLQVLDTGRATDSSSTPSLTTVLGTLLGHNNAQSQDTPGKPASHRPRKRRGTIYQETRQHTGGPTTTSTAAPKGGQPVQQYSQPQQHGESSSTTRNGHHSRTAKVRPPLANRKAKGAHQAHRAHTAHTTHQQHNQTAASPRSGPPSLVGDQTLTRGPSDPKTGATPLSTTTHWQPLYRSTLGTNPFEQSFTAATMNKDKQQQPCSQTSSNELSGSFGDKQTAQQASLGNAATSRYYKKWPASRLLMIHLAALTYYAARPRPSRPQPHTRRFSASPLTSNTLARNCRPQRESAPAKHLAIGRPHCQPTSPTPSTTHGDGSKNTLAPTERSQGSSGCKAPSAARMPLITFSAAAANKASLQHPFTGTTPSPTSKLKTHMKTTSNDSSSGVTNGALHGAHADWGHASKQRPPPSTLAHGNLIAHPGNGHNIPSKNSFKPTQPLSTHTLSRSKSEAPLPHGGSKPPPKRNLTCTPSSPHLTTKILNSGHGSPHLPDALGPQRPGQSKTHQSSNGRMIAQACPSALVPLKWRKLSHRMAIAAPAANHKSDNASPSVIFQKAS